MLEDKLILILDLLIWSLIWFLLAKIYYYIKLHKQRKKAIQNSKKVILGQVNEQIAPLLPNFKYNFKDIVFIWKWIDYIVFDWLSQWELKQIVFLEIKTWKSILNKNEKQIQKIVNDKKIKYEILKL